MTVKLFDESMNEARRYMPMEREIESKCYGCLQIANLMIYLGDKLNRQSNRHTREGE